MSRLVKSLSDITPKKTLPYTSCCKNLEKYMEIYSNSADKRNLTFHTEYKLIRWKKINLLLNDNDANEEVNEEKIITEIKKAVMKVFKNEDKTWYGLTEYHHITVHLKSTNKNVPHYFRNRQRPLKLTKAMRNILTPLLGTINTSHKNWRQSSWKIKGKNMPDKFMYSLDIKSLCTNVPVEKCLNHLIKHQTCIIA